MAKPKVLGYILTSENLTNLGGPMGTESTFENWSKNFSTIEKAKEVAKKDYNPEDSPSKEPIKWVKEKSGLRSQDLGYVMYHIQPFTLEE